MADNQIQDRYKAFFVSDFMPLIRHDQTQGAPERLAYANEYAAYRLEHDAEKCEAVFGQHHALTYENRSRLWFWIGSIQNHRDRCKINKKLGRLIELMEQSGANGVAHD